MTERVLVVVPTYDEVTTLPVTLSRLRVAVPDADVLVVDDASPDGTGVVADELSRTDPNVHVLHRPAKQGLGRAYTAGFGWALERGYDVVVEMDADGSHQPEQLPGLLSRLGAGGHPGPDDGPGVDLVLGSRWVQGGAVRNWAPQRVLLSRAGNAFVRLVLGVPLRDATSGFRAYRAETLRALPLTEIASQGYCFQIDMALRVLEAGGTVREVPIVFVERTGGRSKMSRQIIVEALVRVLVWGARRRGRQLRRVTRGRGAGAR